jgi:hypothetical protein
VTVQLAGEGKDGTFKLDAAAKPKAIDLNLDGGAGLGIFSLEGDTLNICFTDSGKAERPAEFTTNEGDRRVLLILKRPAEPKPAVGAEEKRAEREEPPQVAALNEQLKAVESENEMLKATVKRSREELDGTLTKVDVDKKTVSLSLKGTKLMLDAVALAEDAKFLVGDREVTIDEIKPGMPISRRLRTEGERTTITAVMAPKPGE